MKVRAPAHPGARALAEVSDAVELLAFGSEAARPELGAVEFFVAPATRAAEVRRTLPAMAGLRVVQTLSAGVHWLGDAVPAGVTLCDAAGVHATAELASLLPDADVVVVLLPLTGETEGLFGAELLAAMKPGALLVNAARGEIVDTDALLAALHAGAIRAALDVTDPEPLPDGHPLLAAPGCLVTPHMAGLSPSFPASGYALAARQLERHLDGEPLANVVEGAY